MLVVSEVQTRILPSGLMAIPSGSTPTWMSPIAVAFLDIDNGDGVVVLVGDIEMLAGGTEREQLGIGAGGQVADHFAWFSCRSIWIVSSSPTATMTNLPSLVNSMPRGR